MSYVNTIATLGNPVAYYPAMARAFGGDPTTAIFICQFLYWRGKVGERQVYKTRQDIEAETAISEKRQKRICKQLQEEGVLRIERKSMPARNYYVFDWEEIDRRIEETVRHRETDSPVSTKGPNKRGPKGPTTSETTTEITNNPFGAANKFAGVTASRPHGEPRGRAAPKEEKPPERDIPDWAMSNPHGFIAYIEKDAFENPHRHEWHTLTLERMMDIFSGNDAENLEIRGHAERVMDYIELRGAA